MAAGRRNAGLKLCIERCCSCNGPKANGPSLQELGPLCCGSVGHGVRNTNNESPVWFAGNPVISCFARTARSRSNDRVAKKNSAKL